jgi:hypothetical protein
MTTALLVTLEIVSRSGIEEEADSILRMAGVVEKARHEAVWRH